MSKKVGFIDNLRAVACLMVILIHTCTLYVTDHLAISQRDWDIANFLDSASRVCVPLFFMISGYLFFGERSAQPRHFLRLILCLVFYSAVSLAYITWLTPISEGQSLQTLLQKPVFYHLWFFFALIAVYLFSPLIQVKTISPRYAVLLILLVGIIANPNTPEQLTSNVQWLPVNLFIAGDTIYYLLYALLGRALGVMETDKRWVSWMAGILFLACICAITAGTRRIVEAQGQFHDLWYQYAGPLVFIAAISLFVLFKNCLNQRPLPGLSVIARHSLPVYGFHALFIHFMRTHDLDRTDLPLLDIVMIFTFTLAGSLLLSIGLKRIDTRQYVS